MYEPLKAALGRAKNALTNSAAAARRGDLMRQRAEICALIAHLRSANSAASQALTDFDKYADESLIPTGTR